MLKLIITFLAALYTNRFSGYSDNDHGYYTGLGESPNKTNPVTPDIQHVIIDPAKPNTETPPTTTPEQRTAAEGTAPPATGTTTPPAEGTTEAKKYPVLEEHLTRDEILKRTVEFFPGIDLTKLDQATQESYIEKYTNATLGMNREAWQKQNTQRSQSIAKQNELITTKTNELKIWEDNLVQRTLEAKKNANIDTSNIPKDDFPAQLEALTKKKEAEKELQNLELQTAEYQRAQNALTFAKEFLKLSTEYPANFLFSKDDIIEILADYNDGKPGVDKEEVAKIYELIDLINQANAQGMSTIRYFDAFGYKYPKLSKTADKAQTDLEAKAKEAADRLKAQQEAGPGNSGSTNMSPNNNILSSIGIAGRNRAEILDNINAGAVIHK